jgi:hypothetical protein
VVSFFVCITGRQAPRVTPIFTCNCRQD